MSIIARAITGRVPVELKSERAHRDALEEEQRAAYRCTRFFLLPPKSADLAIFKDLRVRGQVYQAAYYLVARCLDGWESLIGRDGNEVPYPKEPGADTLARLSSSQVLELAEELDALGDPDQQDFA